MGLVPLNCGVSYRDVSRGECQKSIKEAQALLLVPNRFSLSKDEWLDESIIQGYISERKIRPIHVVNLLEDTSAGDITVEENGIETVVKHGEGRLKFQVAGITQCSYLDLKSLEQRIGSAFSVYIIDKADEIGGIFDDKGNLYPIPLNSFTVGQPALVSDGATISKYEVTMRFDFEKLAFSPFGYTFTGFMWNTIDGLINVDIIHASGTGTTVECKVETSCGGTKILDLVAEDFANIGGKSVSSANVNSAGKYTLTLESALTSGNYSVELKDPSSQITKLYVTGRAGDLSVS